MFIGFSRDAVEVVNLAEQHARELGDGHVGAEHILLALLTQEDGLGGQVLIGLGFSEQGVRRGLKTSAAAAALEAQDVPSPGPFVRLGDGLITRKFTPRARGVLEYAVREALVLGSGSIGSEHVLLGLSRQDNSLAMQILQDLDAELPRSDEQRLDRQLDLELRNTVIRALTERGQADHSTAK